MEVPQLQIVRFPLGIQDQLKPYNVYRRTPELHSLFISTPIIGQHCTNTLCYLDMDDIKKNTQFENGKCSICRKQSKHYLHDVGFKQFLYHFKASRGLQQRLPFEVKLNPLRNVFEVSPIEKGLVGHMAHLLGEQFGSKIKESLLIHKQLDIKRISYQKVQQAIKIKFKDCLKPEGSQQSVSLYSWCRHIQEPSKKAHLLMFFKGQENPKKIQLIFVKNETDDKNDKNDKNNEQNFDEAFKDNAQVVYYDQKKIFFIILTTRNITYHFGGCLKWKQKMFQKNTLRMVQIGKQVNIIRKFPSVLVDQRKGCLYILGGFDDVYNDKKPEKIVQYRDLDWNNKFTGKPVNETTELFKKSEQRKQLGGVNNGLRGATMIRYTTIQGADQHNWKKRDLMNDDYTKWISFGGTYCQSGGLISVKIFNQKPGIREILYKKKHQSGQYYVYNNSTSDKIIDQAGSVEADFCVHWPCVMQIPEIGIPELDRLYKNKMLIFGGAETNTKIRTPRSQVYIYDPLLGRAGLYKNGAPVFPNQKVAFFSDNHVTLLRAPNRELYLRMTLPGKYDPPTKMYSYVIVEYELEKKRFRSQVKEYQ